MTQRYDAVISRTDKDGKRRYTKIGAAFPMREGDGINIILDALPMPGPDGQAFIALFVPRDDKQKPQQRQQAQHSPRADMDDSIPFAPEVRG